MSAKRLSPWTPGQERRSRVFIRAITALNVWTYRLTKGRLGSRFPGGAPICLLTTRGRKSGELRTVALLYLRDGERVVLVASKGGMSQHPAWYFNLQAEPRCDVQVGSELRTMQARTASPDEKRLFWPQLVALYPAYADYQARTTRDIPVVICEPS